jgi:hypothetical protein
MHQSGKLGITSHNDGQVAMFYCDIEFRHESLSYKVSFVRPSSIMSALFCQFCIIINLIRLLVE